LHTSFTGLPHDLENLEKYGTFSLSQPLNVCCLVDSGLPASQGGPNKCPYKNLVTRLASLNQKLTLSVLGHMAAIVLDHMAVIVLDHMAAIVLDHMAAIVLGHMAAIVLRPFSRNFTRSETHAVKNSEEVSSEVNIARSPP
jgi:hypothetical protein